MKILFIVPYSQEGASNRYRVGQYLPYLKAKEISYDVRPFVFDEFYKILYLKGRCFKKIIYFLRALLFRIIDIFRLYKYDVVFIHREACPFGPPIFEWFIYALGKPIIYDFDDAIFLPNYNPINRFYRFLKFPSKTQKIIKMSSCVIVANGFLQEYACKFNSRVYIIPTAVNTERFGVVEKSSDKIVIGWIGSPTTEPYLKLVCNAMQILSQKYSFIFKIVGAGNKIFIPNVEIENYEWQLEKEISDFKSIDIGIYPLPDTTWARGKAGFKAIQFMAVGVPVVASPVGMTEELIQDGVNGFLASSDEDWVKKISMLIENLLLRKKMGLAGRRTIEEGFSVKVNAPKYLKIIHDYELQAKN